MRKGFVWPLVLIGIIIAFAGSLGNASAYAFDPLPVALPSTAGIAGGPPGAAENKVGFAVQQVLQASDPGQMIPIIITLKKQADLGAPAPAERNARVRYVVEILQETARTSQGPVRAFLETERARGLAGPVTPFWVFNGLAVSVRAVVADRLAERTDVARITLNETFEAPSLAAGTASPEPNLVAISAPSLWDLGYSGQGVVVANVDTGVSLNHPDLIAQWRGGSNSWFDPNNEHPDVPTDLDGHGTRTMGVMVGRDAGGTAIGVAPDAQWIAVKIFNDRGEATTAGIHSAYQWLLDPDGDPATADAPHVINSSWGYASPGCSLEFQLDLQALRAANILPVFSAGNAGPSGATSVSPANNPEAFAVGGIDDFDQIYTYSSRGPSSCGEATTVYPELVAPGVDIRTTDRYGTYVDATGTSLAAPHAAGALALLLSARPDLSADEQAGALLAGAFDLGSAGPDNDFGYGRLDVLAAYQSLPPGGPTPTPTASPTPTPAPSVNLALDRPVTVSSFEDDSHMGDMSVDGDLLTFWRTEKAVGKDTLPSEWIIVDLGSSMTVGAVQLEWESDYAIAYSIQLSNDGQSWTTVFSTAAGDGGQDALSFPAAVARYVQMDSTAWSSASQRNWLREFEVYAGGGSPGPTPTPTATPPAPTATPTPTPTPGSGGTMHVGDLDGASSPGNRNRWDATVTITVHDADESPVVGATVSGTWSGGASGGGSCVTEGAGACSIVKSNIKSNVSSVTFIVDAVSHASTLYQASDNHDPDGDSTGTIVTVSKP